MFEAAVVIALIVYFIKATTWKGMIFEKIGKFLDRILPEKLYKPIIGCPVCMTIWWGLLVYFIGYFTNIELFQDIRAQVVIYTLFIASGINTVILMLNKVYDVAKKEDKILEPVVKKAAKKQPTVKKIVDKPEKRVVKKPRAKAKGVQPISELIKRHKYA